MQRAYRTNSRIPLAVLVMMLAGMVLAACGGTPAASTPGASESPAAQASPPGGDTATTPTTGGEAGAVSSPTAAAAAETSPMAEASPTTGPDMMASPAATGTTGAGGPAADAGNCGLGADIGQVQLPPDADPNGELKYNMQIDTDSADPQQASYSHEIDVMSQVYTSLLTLNGKGEPSPAAAESCNVSEDGKTYTLKIRDHTYSDGQPVTAENFEYAIKRNCDPRVGGEYSQIMFDIAGCEKARLAYGEDPENPVQIPDAQLQKLIDQVGVNAVDPKTLEFKLGAPASHFPFILTLWTTMPARQDLVEKGGARWWTNPQYYIGNGPFKLTSYAPRRERVFERNDNFFRGKPGLAKMTWAMNAEANNYLPAYQSGQYDMLEPDETQLPRLERTPALKTDLKRQASTLSSWVDMNLAKKPFNDVRVRQAIGAAFNDELYIRQILNGAGQPSGQLQSPVAPIGRVPADQEQRYDLAKAKQLLADAGYPNGQGWPQVQYQYSSASADSKRAAEWFAQHMKQQLGVTITPVAVDPVELTNRRKSADPTKAPDMNAGGWYQDYSHPQNWGPTLFGSGSGFAPPGWNRQTASDYYDLIRRAVAEQDLEKAAPLYEQANKLLIDKSPVAFRYYGEDFLLSKPNVKGIVPAPGSITGLQRQSFNIYKTQQ